MRRRVPDDFLTSPWTSSALVRAELFSVERLEQHAESLAEAQPVAGAGGAAGSLSRRVNDNYRLLVDAHRSLVRASADGQPMTPAAQWLTDNFHVVEAQISGIRQDLPAGFYRQLPKLATGPFTGYPRVLGLSWAFVAHTDSQFEPETLCRFVRAYQRVQSLTIGELWAVAITLRIVLVENLRRAATLIIENRLQRQRANALADSILGVGMAEPAPLPDVLQRMPDGTLHPTFAVQLIKRLHDQSSAVTPTLLWLEEHLAAQGTTADDVVREVHQNQAAMTVTVRNIITSMRMISEVDWTELFEDVSQVDELLRRNSGFAQMDFATRNNYRIAIEELARGSGLSERDITREVLRATRDGRPDEEDTAAAERRRDPGFYLIGAGRDAFEAAIGFRPSILTWLRRATIGHGLRGYAGAIALVTAVFAAIAVQGLANRGLGSWGLLAFAALSLFPAADAAIAVVNRLVTGWLRPAALPALALNDGISNDFRTMIVVPTLLTTQESIAEQIQRLEIHYLTSPSGAVTCALLTDWIDAAEETAPGDEALLAVAAEGIGRLNALHQSSDGNPIFLLLHRRRTWNSGENLWMGWERKRGKLHELNRLLRGATDTTFMPIGGKQPVIPADVRFVITLDSDTRLPPEAVRRLIGKMAHPLNRPRFDPVLRRVVDGHAIMQPRVTPSLPVGAEASLYQYAFASAGGIDPYAAAVSDVYQDLFREGSYAGKGIYDVDVFEQALGGVVPDNAMLSHDLFEGIFARAAFVSDIEVVEEFPARYDIAVSRQHRWTRGDWQLLPWIFGHVRAGIPATGLWKMLDNLRRGLTPPMTVLALLAGWLLSFDQALGWTVFVLLTVMLPALLPVVVAVIPTARDVTLASHARAVGADAGVAGTQVALIVTLLAEQAALMTDAIVRTLNRLFVTRRRLLEWTTAEQAKSNATRNISGYYRRMPGTVVLGAVALASLAVAQPFVWVLAVPLGILWLLAPAIAWWASQSPNSADSTPISKDDARALRLVARRTWGYFEAFVTPADNMLPPDNFQEDPRTVVAHRTSPTNIGLYLLSAVAARDFGWACLTDTVERLEATFATLDRMERLRGHFFNWYDTSDLRPLEPKYISSVDSGNLAGHLIVVGNACQGWTVSPLRGPGTIAGIRDALDIARQYLDRLDGVDGTESLQDALTAAAASFEGDEDDAARLPAILLHAEAVAGAATSLHAAVKLPQTQTILDWANAARRSAEAHSRDAALLNATDGTSRVPTLAEMAAAPAMPCGAARQSTVRELRDRLLALSARAHAMAAEMRFDFLLDPDRKLLSIGFRVSDSQLDQSSYDLLASEARLASFIAIANGDVPVSHWFRLGRSVTPVHHGAALISWSGSMFEYLMPSLVMRAPTGSLLATTNGLIVRRQIDYGKQLGIGWGMSESAYNVRDLEMTYQYSNFGIPDLALKRGLGENVVLAPYATALAAMVDAAAAVRNLARLEGEGGLGSYGFYEALDYTRARVPEGQNAVIVRAYMAHHQGMSIVSVANTVLGGIMRTRFHAEPRVQATELLLEERTPRRLNALPEQAEDTPRITAIGEYDPTVSRRLSSPHGATPVTHVLSNGRYSVMVTAAGSGYSRWQGRAITRWREDMTCDDWGSYVYLRDVDTDSVWSAAYQPTGREPDNYTVIFTEERAEFQRRDGTLATTLEITVSGEDDCEVRRVSVANNGTKAREIELTSYMEVVLARPADDNAHPAFSKMFVQTEFDPERGIVLATRRRRAPSEPEIWACHFVIVDGEAIGDPHVETDRAEFLGRGRSTRDPAAMTGGRPLAGTVGTVLDPIFSLRRRVRIAPGATTRLSFWTCVADTRANLMTLADKHRNRAAYERAVTLAWTQARVQLHHLGIRSSDASNFQRLAGHLIFVNALLRPAPDVLWAGGAGPAALWANSISGDLPILLVRIDDIDDIESVRELLLAHEYWRMKQLAIDLVILNEKPASYNQDLQLAIDAAVRMSQTRLALGSGDAMQGNVFLLRGDLIAPEALALLLSVARVVLVSARGRLADQLDRLDERRGTPVVPPARPASPPVQERGWPIPELEFFNGWGGFAEDGREYVTILRPGVTTPAPWTNVIANASFGFQVTAEGGGYSWWRNSRENQLTPWSNDPVGDRSGDVLYVRDDEDGTYWSPTPQPVRYAAGHFEIRHGMGYTRFRSMASGIELELTQFVPLEDPIKISRLRLRNMSGRPRRLSLTHYVEWVLGPSRAAALATVVTEYDPSIAGVLARNPWNTAFGAFVAFTAMPGRVVEVTGDRREFMGRNGSLATPAALTGRGPLSGKTGAGLDPCTALRTVFTLQPDETIDLVVLLGANETREATKDLVQRYSAADLDAVLAAVNAHWQTVTGAIQVSTPDRSMDIMLNGWLLYQTLACRFWARAGFYQASGAFGFRDQLQDGMALANVLPDLTRGHLLRAAARQFPEGDVQHWWLPPGGQGVRTRISDDRVWLAYAAEQYVTLTDDIAVLDERVPFLSGQLLGEHEHEAYFLPQVSETTATLFEHCALGLDHALATGRHGLPLIGTGDWNDGMSRVGEAGLGESVWLGWFLYTTLLAFAPRAEARGEGARAAAWRAHAAALRTSLADNAWDGAWYRRGYFDDGTPLGSSVSAECRIDAIAQSWSVISGAADTGRATRAMSAVREHLIRRHDKLALLFTPPFDRMTQDPGYIKGYPPGLRENGGQYTHGGIWSIIAFARLGDGDNAGELFSMLNPINHALTSADAWHYKVEPYVIAADIYSATGHVGRGGWTWYTGSAGWMYRAGIESILGLRREGRTLVIDPRVPTAWRRFEMRVRHGDAHYVISVENPYGVSGGVEEAWVDGDAIDGRPVRIQMVDGVAHAVRLVLGPTSAGSTPNRAEQLSK